MSSTDEPTDDFAASFDMVADEIEALFADDATGGGMMSLDAAEGEIEAIREQLRALARGELP